MSNVVSLRSRFYCGNWTFFLCVGLCLASAHCNGIQMFCSTFYYTTEVKTNNNKKRILKNASIQKVWHNPSLQRPRDRKFLEKRRYLHPLTVKIIDLMYPFQMGWTLLAQQLHWWFHLKKGASNVSPNQFGISRLPESARSQNWLKKAFKRGVTDIS